MKNIADNLKIVICGNYGATNLGDEVILDGILALIRNVAPKAHITVLSVEPEATRQMHEVDSVPLIPTGIRSLLRGIFKGTLWKTIKTIKNCDAFILGGGGLFSDEKMQAIIIWSVQAKLALFCGKALFCLGQSVGPLNTSFGRKWTYDVYSRARVATVRDQESQKVLHRIGVPMTRVLADPAFSTHVESFHDQENYIVMSLRPWIKGESTALYKNCAQFIDWVWHKYGFRTLLLPFQILADNDAIVLNKIFDQIKRKKTAELVGYSTDYRSAINIIGKAQAVVGMRLHSLIFSTLTLRPFLALSYSDKVRQFATDLGLQDYVIDWENMTLESLQKNFDKMMAQKEYIQTVLMEKNFRLRQKAREHEELLRDFFASTHGAKQSVPTPRPEGLPGK